MQLKAIKIITLSFFSYFLLVTAPVANAYNFKDNSGVNTVADGAGYMDGSLENLSVFRMIARVVTAILGFLGIFFFLLTLYAGATWMFSRGNSQSIDKAKSTLQNALIGLIIVILSYSLTAFVMNNLLGT